MEYEVTVKDGELSLSQEAIDLFKTVKAIDATIKDLKAQKEAIEGPLKAAMQKHGINKFTCDGLLTATTIAGGWSEEVDTERMKKDGIYETYMFRVPKSGYVRINYKKEKK